MTQIAFGLPDPIFSALRLPSGEFMTEMCIAAAVQGYAERRLSQGKAAEVSGLTRAAFIHELWQRKVPAIQVEVDELDAELGG